MNKKLFEELSYLMSKKNDYEEFLKELKNTPYINKISLSKGLYTIYLDDEDLEVLIKMYENKIEEINKKIDKFKLSKIID